MLFADSAAATVTLAAGVNTLMLRRDASDVGAVDLDTLTVGATIAPPPPPVVGDAALAWDVSASTAESSLSGYRVYWRKLPEATYQQPLGGGVLVTTNTHAVTSLPAGSYCFAITALGVRISDGVTSESAYSTEACKTIL